MVTIAIDKSRLEKQALAQYHSKAMTLIDRLIEGDDELDWHPTATEKTAIMQKYAVADFDQAMTCARLYHEQRFDEETSDDEMGELLELPSVEEALDAWIDDNLMFGSEPRTKVSFEITTV